MFSALHFYLEMLVNILSATYRFTGREEMSTIHLRTFIERLLCTGYCAGRQIE